MNFHCPAIDNIKAERHKNEHPKNTGQECVPLLQYPWQDDRDVQ
jgi:hypothetical protein